MVLCPGACKQLVHLERPEISSWLKVVWCSLQAENVLNINPKRENLHCNNTEQKSCRNVMSFLTKTHIFLLKYIFIYIYNKIAYPYPSYLFMREFDKLGGIKGTQFLSSDTQCLPELSSPFHSIIIFQCYKIIAKKLSWHLRALQFFIAVEAEYSN